MFNFTSLRTEIRDKRTFNVSFVCIVDVSTIEKCGIAVNSPFTSNECNVIRFAAILTNHILLHEKYDLPDAKI